MDNAEHFYGKPEERIYSMSVGCCGVTFKDGEACAHYRFTHKPGSLPGFERIDGQHGLITISDRSAPRPEPSEETTNG